VIAGAASRRRLKRHLLAALLLSAAAATTALGIWQLERRAWKLALIASVDARAHAAPVAAPGPAEWSRLTAEGDAYRRVRVTGRFEHSKEAGVQAATGRGEGQWVMTPLQTDWGWTVLVNRGFLPAGLAGPNRPGGRVTVTGLLRVTEPGGAFLRSNDPHEDRWYSRDVAAIARARGIGTAAPYFIDADAVAGSHVVPVGGLTVIHFRNAHLAYAITWFVLAGMSIWGLWFLVRDRR
jgi:surfeit locus 1 family protein